MKVAEMIKGLEKCTELKSDRLYILFNKGGYTSTNNPEFVEAFKAMLNFLKAYQARVKQLEGAMELVNKAREIMTGKNSFEYMQDIQGELDILTSFYDDGENPLEEEKVENVGYEQNAKKAPSILSTQRFA